jgi:hypothetical protein
MEARARKTHRILAVQRQMHRIEEWKLAQLEQELAQLEALKVDLMRALNDDSALHGLFIDVMARQLNSLTERTARVDSQKQEQLPRLISEATKVKMAEKATKLIDLEVRRSDDLKVLLDTIENIVGRKITSLR